MFKWFPAAALFVLFPIGSYAQVVNLPLTADYCAIKQAMTGHKPAECPQTLDLGLARSLETESDAPGSSRGYFVHFEFDSDALSDSFQEHLSELSKVLMSADMQSACLKLVGHTDSVGSEDYNLELSDRRARSVRLYLVGLMGMEDTRVLSEGRGESQPIEGIATTDDVQRRVEVLAKEALNGSCED